MKRILFTLATFALLAASTFNLASCSSEDGEAVSQEQKEAKKGRIRLQCTMPALTVAPLRASLSANGKAITDLYILDYNTASGDLLQVLHQTATAEDFAEPDLMLNYGAHTLRVVATMSEAPTLLNTDGVAWNCTDNVLMPLAGGSAPAFLTSKKTNDTFAAETEVTITPGAAQDVSITLERIVSRLAIKIADAFPDDCSTIDVSLNEYSNLALENFSVIGPVKNQRITDVSSLVGKSGITVSYYLLAPADGYTTDVTITPNKSGCGSYQSVTVSDVPFERNKITTITGTIYGHRQGVQIGLNDAWSEEAHDVNI